MWCLASGSLASLYVPRVVAGNSSWALGEKACKDSLYKLCLAERVELVCCE